MIDKQEEELIINNAMEFLKRKDLILTGDTVSLPLSILRKLQKDYTVTVMYYVGSNVNIVYKVNNTRYSLLILEDTNNELIKLFKKTLNRLEKQYK